MELNRDTMKKLRSLILFTILVLAAMLNYQRILELLGKGIAMAAPFLLGGAIAFILNVPMRKIERD
ncbi:MAG: AI-2E family transporter, partial [Lachnospiraceae bacterium]